MLRTIHPWIAIIAFLCFMSACKPSPSDLFRAIDAGDVKAVKRAVTVPRQVAEAFNQPEAVNLLREMETANAGSGH